MPFIDFSMDNSKYHVLILAAGKSTRLAHLTRGKPKCFLEIGGKSIIGRMLDCLSERGIKEATIVIGYMSEFFMKTLGNKYKNIDIDYIVMDDYATTLHGWGFYLTKDRWQKSKKPVIFMDADNIFDPKLIDKLLEENNDNVSLIDNNPENKNTEEELVIGDKEEIKGFERGIFSKDKKFLGEFVGINKFSPEFMENLYKFMDSLGDKIKILKYEKVFDKFINFTKNKINYLKTGGLKWVNVNNEYSFEKAKKLALFEF